MARVTEIRIRADWGVVRMAYLPAIAAGMGATKLLWPLVLFSFRIHLCGICILLSRWGNHVEEWVNCKPLLQITDYGLRYENGGAPVEYAWADIVAIVMHRRNVIPPWRTNGSTRMTPPYWLAISVRGSPSCGGSGDRYIDRMRFLDRYGMTESAAAAQPGFAEETISFGIDGYVDRQRDLGNASDDSEADARAEDDIRTICIWPRQVVGGLFSLMRFAKELQRCLIELADRGEIPKLLSRAR